MKIYELPEGLKTQISQEMDKAPDKAIFGAMAKQIYPTIQGSALLIGEKIEMVSYV